MLISIVTQAVVAVTRNLRFCTSFCQKAWLQGSVYISNETMTSAAVTNILDELLIKNTWLGICMRDCRETNIGKEHSKNHVFDKYGNSLRIIILREFLLHYIQ